MTAACTRCWSGCWRSTCNKALHPTSEQLQQIVIHGATVIGGVSCTHLHQDNPGAVLLARGVPRGRAPLAAAAAVTSTPYAADTHTHTQEDNPTLTHSINNTQHAHISGAGVRAAHHSDTT